MITDSLLTSHSKSSYQRLYSTGTSLTNVSSLSTQQIILKGTCSCSTCTCSNNTMIYQNKIKSDTSQNDSDYLVDAFITLYECSLWCMQLIYELFFKSLWQILIYVKQEVQNSRNDNQTNTSVDMMSINKSPTNTYSLISMKINYSDSSRYHLRLNEARNCQRRSRLLRNTRLDNVKVGKKIHYSSSNQISCEQNDSYSIDRSIIIIPVRSSCCQTEMIENDILQTINLDLNQSEKTIHLHDQLTNTLHRDLHQPLTFMNREGLYRQNRNANDSIKPTDLQETIVPNLSWNRSEFNSLQNLTHEKSDILRNQKTLFNKATNKISSTLSASNKQLFPRTNKLLPLTTVTSTNVQSVQTCASNMNKKHVCQPNKRKESHKKKSKDHSIPLVLAASLHSNISFYNENDCLTKYIDQLFNDKLHCRKKLYL